MAKLFSWRVCPTQFVKIGREQAERLAKSGEYIDPNPFARKYSKEEKAANKLAAEQIGIFPPLERKSDATTPN